MGKTTAAKHVMFKYGNILQSLSQPVKEIGATWFGVEGKLGEDRTTLQKLGDALLQVDPLFLLRQMEYRRRELLCGAPVVLDDVRTQEEVDYLLSGGWFVIRIGGPSRHRSLTRTQRSHRTERVVCSPYMVGIENTESLDAFYRRIERAIDIGRQGMTYSPAPEWVRRSGA